MPSLLKNSTGELLPSAPRRKAAITPKKGKRTLLWMGGGLAALAFVVVYLFMSRFASTGAAGAAMSAQPTVPSTSLNSAAPISITLVTASRDIPAFTMLGAGDLKASEVAASTVPSGTVSTSPADLYGKMLQAPISKGDRISPDMLAQGGFSTMISPTLRAYSLPIEARNAFGGGISAGDHIDMLWTVDTSHVTGGGNGSGNGNGKTGGSSSTKTVLKDILVMKVIDLVTPLPAPAAPKDGSPAPTPGPNRPPATLYQEGAQYAAVLVLAVSNEQIEAIEFARQNGTLALALRPRMAVAVKDDSKDTGGMTLKQFVEKYGVPVP